MAAIRRGKKGESAPATVERATLAPIDLRETPFDLEATLTCGQVFHWRREQTGWLGAVGDTPLYAEQSGGSLFVSRGCEKLARDYFALDHPLDDICDSFPRDPAMVAATAFCRGLRIIRQPLWECLATFLTSAMKRIPHIAQISHRLREAYGTRLGWAGAELFAYPSAARIAELSEPELRACRLGFRAKNLLRTAQLVAGGSVDLNAIRQLPDAEAQAELCRLPGVGPKIANCVLLFGCERLRAFPIDVWIGRVLRGMHAARRGTVTLRELEEFSKTHFGPFSGYAQQYLFHHARLAGNRLRPQ